MSPPPHPWHTYMRRHDITLRNVKANLGGTIFTKAPFDLIDDAGRFVQLKVKESKRAIVGFTPDEVEFALRKDLWLFLVYQGNNYFFPFDDRIRARLRKSKQSSNKIFGVGKGQRSLTFGKKFLITVRYFSLGLFNGLEDMEALAPGNP